VSVCLSRPGTDLSPDEIESPGFHRMIAHRVSSFVCGNLVPLGEEIPLKRGHQRVPPPPKIVNIIIIIIIIINEKN